MLTRIEDDKLKMEPTHAESIRTYLNLLAAISDVIRHHQRGGAMKITVSNETSGSCEVMKGAADDIIALLRGEKLRIRKRLRELYGIVIE